MIDYSMGVVQLTTYAKFVEKDLNLVSIKYTLGRNDEFLSLWGYQETKDPNYGGIYLWREAKDFKCN